MTTYDGDADSYRALKDGACGYPPKNMLRQEAVSAVRAAVAGRHVIPPAVSSRLAEFTPRPALTAREVEVVRLVAKGLRNDDVRAGYERLGTVLLWTSLLGSILLGVVLVVLFAQEPRRHDVPHDVSSARGVSPWSPGSTATDSRISSAFVCDHVRPDVPERGAQRVSRRSVSPRRNAVRFRAAGGGFAQTRGISASDISASRASASSSRASG
jgi:hypothetical protein